MSDAVRGTWGETGMAESFMAAIERGETPVLFVMVAPDGRAKLSVSHLLSRRPPEEIEEMLATLTMQVRHSVSTPLDDLDPA